MSRNSLLFGFAFSCMLVIELAGAQGFVPDEHVIFEFHSRESDIWTNHTIQDIESTKGRRNEIFRKFNFDATRPTRIFIHGFLSNRETLDKYAAAYSRLGDFNFIAINWLRGAVTIRYVKARLRVRAVAETVAELIDYLVKNGMDLKDLIVVGHSLGAHIAGIAGKNVKSGKVGVIVGLDPALPLFRVKNPKNRLNFSDARYVQIIHTSGVLGIKHPLGHADFYPNFGFDQPGCGKILDSKLNRQPISRSIIIIICIFSLSASLDVCSHTRVHDLFLESLSSTFWAVPCASYQEIADQKCTKSGPMVRMGGDRNILGSARGIFHLKTNQRSPYALGRA